MLNYDDLENSLEELSRQAERKKGSALEQELAPLRDAIVRARKSGVTLKDIFGLLQSKGLQCSPSAFAKYAQKHLQAGARRSPRPTHKQRTKQVTPPGVAKPVEQRAKPRIASGNY